MEDFNEDNYSQRSAHNSGFVHLCPFDGERFLSAGSDGDVQLWGCKSSDLCEDEPESNHLADSITALVSKGTKLFVGQENGGRHEVQVYEWECESNSTRPLSVLAKSTLSVTCLHLHPTQPLLAVGYADFEIKLLPTEDSALPYIRFTGHEAPILGLAIQPQGDYLASSSCDGTVRLWNTKQAADALVVLRTLSKTNEKKENRSQSSLIWTTDGKQLIVACVGKLSVYSVSDMFAKQTHEYVDPKCVDTTYSMLSVSVNGDYIAASTVCAHVCVWATRSRALLLSLPLDPDDSAVPCALMWHPKQHNQLVLADTEGQIGCIRDLKLSLTAAVGGNEQSGRTSVVSAQSGNEEDAFAQFESPPRPSRIVDDDDEASRSSSINAIKRSFAIANEDEAEADDFMDDLDSYSNPPPPVKAQSNHSHEWHRPSAPAWTPPKLPVPFVPSSTPLGLTDRYMKWNNVGVIRQWSNNEPCIEIEFHDRSVHAAVTIDNETHAYTMADMSSEAYVLAAPANTRQKTPRLLPLVLSVMSVTHYAAWDGARDWQTELPIGESITCVVLGAGWLAVSTTLNNIRVWTVAGTQLYIHTMHGVVRVLQRQQQCTWLPIMQLANECKNACDFAWLYALNESTAQLHYVLVRAGRHPPLVPKPIPLSCAWTLPLCDQGTEKCNNEATLMSSRIREQILQENKDANQAMLHDYRISQQAAVLKLFSLCCQSNVDRLARALELAGLLGHSSQVQSLIKYANRCNKSVLVEKLSEVAREKAHAEAELMAGFDQSQTHTGNHVTNSSGPSSTANDASGFAPLTATTVKRRRETSGTALTQTNTVPDGHSTQSPSQTTTNTIAAVYMDTNTAHAPRANPFKAAGHRSGALFDMMEAPPPERVTSPELTAPKKRKQQATLQFGASASAASPKVPMVSGFSLWLDSARIELMARDDAPDTHDTHAVHKYAMQHYRLLTAEDKKKWNEQARSQKALTPVAQPTAN